MRARPLTLRQANQHITAFHRHHKKVQGHRFSIGAEKDGALVGVCVVGRPVAHKVPQYTVAEVTRLCTDGTKNACSFLYAAAARACEAMGFEKIQTYILDSELGTSLKASGWVEEHTTEGGSWSRTGRPREDNAPTVPKTRWAKYFKR